MSCPHPGPQEIADLCNEPESTASSLLRRGFWGSAPCDHQCARCCTSTRTRVGFCRFDRPPLAIGTGLAPGISSLSGTTWPLTLSKASRRC